MEMEKLLQMGKEFGLEGEKLLEFVERQQKLEEEKQEKRRQLEEEREEKRRRALLSGRALEGYSRLSEEAAQDYDRVKLALMKRYDLTEDGYRRKFRASKPEVDESPEQFIVRLDRYLLRWLELSNTARTFDGLKDLIVKEQFIDSCPKMPVVKGRVGEKPVDVLRDTGCSGVAVKRDLVSEDQFTGEFNVMLLIDNTARKVPIAKIDVDTPYLKGQVEAQCLPDAVYDLIIGNVPGARAADDPDPSWQVPVQEACAVTTRSQAKKAGEHIPLKVPGTKGSPVVDREKQMQRDDESLQKFWEKDDIVARGQAETSFEVKGGVLYRVHKHPYQEIPHINVPIEALFQDKQELTTCQRMVKEGQMYHGLNYVYKKNSGSYLVQFETVNLIHLALERFNILSNTGMWVMLL
ncbi:uncharacterized protein [Montipora capricornis]|uniref:uncharacterized protein n=1 Tax=Montipora capricornis TaxID=246305 RepID=UPI0035F1CE63